MGLIPIFGCFGKLKKSFLNKAFATVLRVPEFLVEWKAHILNVSCFFYCRNCTETGLINNGQDMPSFLLYKLGFFEYYQTNVSPLVV